MMEINVNGVDYPKEEILRLENFSGDFTGRTLKFIKEWISGNSHFEMTTSGSTGKPKPITLTRAQLRQSAILTIDTLALKPGMISLLCLDPSFIAGKMMIVRSLENDMKLIAVDPSSNPFTQIGKTQRIDFAAFVPYQIKSIVESDERTRFNELTCALIGGAPLERELQRSLLPYSCAFYETYGMTETASHIALRKISDEYFTPLKGISLSTDERGCLVISADHILDKKVVTNDLVEFNTDGCFKWLGRIDNVINSGGIKISPESIEKKINNLLHDASVEVQFFVCGIPDTQFGETVAMVVKKSAMTPSMIQELLQSLPSVERPKSILEVVDFIFTDTGKINRRETLKSVLR